MSTPCARSLWMVLAVVALAALAAPARAQVNAEALRPDPLRAGWSRTIDGSLALATGNVALLDVGGAARVQYQTLRPGPVPFIRQRGLIAASARYAERADAAFIDQAFVHARWTAMWWPRLGTDVFAQHQANQFLRLRGRAIAGEALARVTTVFAFGATLSVLHDRAPPTGVAPTDVRLTSTVRATF